MANEHIGRLSAVGLGKESTAGTIAVADVRIPKETGVLIPEFEEAIDASGYGVIDEVYDSATTKNFSKITLGGITRDDFIGHLLYGALGSYDQVQCITLPSPSGGTPARGDIAYVGAPASETWIGEIKKILSLGGTLTTYYFVSTTSGTLGNADTVTNGTRTATVGVTATSAVKGHFFSRNNDNSHQTYTLYDDDPVGAVSSTYGMVNTLELSAEVGDYVKFSAEYWGQQMATASAQIPSYSAENPFRAMDSNVYFAATEGALNAATAVCMQNFRLAINKNLTDIQCFGSTDIDSLHNQQFTTEGDFEALYNSVTLRNYVIDSDKKATRFELINDDVTALVASQIFPSMFIDFMKVGFKEWTKTDSANDIIKQTMGYSGQYDVDTSAQIEVLLLNDNATGY